MPSSPFRLPAERKGLRGDVQALRALAVTLVILNHTDWHVLPGGFVGVDVFFVISGYLISGLLFREVRRAGRVSLIGFYARRARRILPASTVALLATVTASLFILPLTRAIQVATDAIWAVFFAANFRFASTGTNYFDSGQSTSPLQHYWSLAVEEQFYLVWPLLLMLTLWLASKVLPTNTERVPRHLTAAVLGTITVASLDWAVFHGGTQHPVTAYFDTFGRAYELALGGAAALLAPDIVRRLRLLQRTGLVYLGLTLIGVSCFVIDSSTFFPGYAALLPVTGTMLVLVGGEHRNPVLLLSIKPLRIFGDWSFSLYLWHFPVLNLWRAHEGGGPLSSSETLEALALTVLVSWASYRFIETPFRNGSLLPRRWSLVLYPIGIAAVFGLVAASPTIATWRTGGFDHHPAITTANFTDGKNEQYQLDADQRIAEVQAAVIAARNGMAIPSDLHPKLVDLPDAIGDVGACDYTTSTRKLCLRGDPTGDKTLVVMGDSHARAWIPAFDQIGAEFGYKVYYLVKPQCTAALVEPGLPNVGAPNEPCVAFHTWAMRQVAALKPDLSVVTSVQLREGVWVNGEHIDNYDDWRPLMQRGWETLLQQLGRDSARVVYLRDVPMDPNEPGDCLSTPGNDLKDCLFTPTADTVAQAQIGVDAARAVGVPVADLTRYLCWNYSCPAVVGSTITYRDTGHITPERAAELTAPLAQALGIVPETATPSPTAGPSASATP